MSRSSGGTYSLPPGNPVVTGTTIFSFWANDTMSDLATELTDSLSRTGKGGMLFQIRGVDGTAAAPALSFTSETGLGLYRGGAADLRFVALGSDIATFTSTAVTIARAVSASVGLTVTNSTTNGNGTTSTGNGTGSGVRGTGGATGPGVTGIGGTTSGNGGTFSATSGHGVSATGAGTGNAAFNGSGPFGVIAVGTANEGVVGTGAAGSAGGWFRNGTAATASARQNAALLSNGDLSFAGTTNPNSDVAHSNVLGPLNLPKAWAQVTTDGAGGVTINDGFNIASAAITGDDIRITFGSAFSSTAYAPIVQADLGTIASVLNPKTTTTIDISLTGRNAATTVNVVYLHVFGRQ